MLGLYERFKVMNAASDETRFDLVNKAAAAFEKHAYHPCLQSNALHWRNSYKLNKEDKLVDAEAIKLEEGYNARLTAMLPLVAKDKDAPPVAAIASPSNR
jgi:hypothetical protein